MPSRGRHVRAQPVQPGRSALLLSFLYDPYTGPLEEHGDYANVMGAIEYLRAGPQQPFMLYLPLVFPHCPYSAPQPWHDLVDPTSCRRCVPRAAQPARLPRTDRQTRRLDEVDDGHLRKVQAVYLGMTSFMDHLLGMLLETLEETGHADDTTMVYFSDHGDWAGDYGLVEKVAQRRGGCAHACHSSCARRGAAGHVVDEPVELFDVMATTLELAGIEAQHTHFARSLVPQVHGAAGDPDRAVFIEGGYARHEPHCFEGMANRDQFARDASHIYYPKGRLQQDHPDSVGRTVAVRTMTHKLVRRPTGVNELYAYDDDPRELDNRYGDPALADVQRALESRLLDWSIQTSDVTPFDQDPRGLPQ
ncbi:MAG: sulfatase-like hydrolase/transferase [Caldilineaceae bacterium]